MDDYHPVKKIAVYLFDVRNRNVGLGEFTFQLGKALALRAPELKSKYGIELCLIVPKKFVGCFGDEVEYIVLNFINWHFNLKWFKKGIDIYHSTHQCTRLKFMRRAGINLLTVHDINFMYEKSGSKLEKYKRKFTRALAHADVVTYISDFVKHDVEAHFAPRYDGKVIYNGVADLSGVEGNFSKFNLEDGGYLFHISSCLPKKNVHKIVEMMRYLPEERLVVVGNLNSNYIRGIQENVEKWGLKNVTMLTNVGNEDKAELYRHCKGFLFPSLCEGFGLPPIEAMHFGKPVFLSALTSLPEIGGDSAYYYHNLDPEAMAETTRNGLAEFYADPQANGAMLRERAASFNWEKCADEYMKLYIELLNK